MTYRIAAAPLALVLWTGAAVAQDDPQTVGVSVDGTVVEIAVDLAAEACGIEAETLLAEWEALGTELETMADTSVRADATDLAPDVAVDTQMDSVLDGQTVTDGADATNEADGEPAQDVASDVNAGTEGSTTVAGATTTDGSAGAAAEGAEDMVSGVEQTMADTEPGSEPDVPVDGSMDAGVELSAEQGVTGDDPATADLATIEEVDARTEQELAGDPATPTIGSDLRKAAVCEISQDTATSLGIALPG